MSQTVSNELNFDTLPEYQIPPMKIVIQGKDYELRAATGGQMKKFHNLRLSKISFTNGGKINRIGDAGDMEPFLISLCLFLMPDNVAVPVAHIEKFDCKIQNRLFQEARRICRIDKTSIDPMASLLVKLLKDPRASVDVDALLEIVREDEQYEGLENVLTGTDALAKN